MTHDANHTDDGNEGEAEVTSSSSDELAIAVERGDLIERLRPDAGCCAFCGMDPYHYVDNGVGMERVAVTCCDEGVALYQHGDRVLGDQVGLRYEAADLIERLTATIKAQEETMRADREIVNYAGDIRWEELASGSEFSLIDRQMLGEMHGLARARLAARQALIPTGGEG